MSTGLQNSWKFNNWFYHTGTSDAKTLQFLPLKYDLCWMWWLLVHKGFLSKRVYPGLPEILDFWFAYLMTRNTSLSNVASAHLVIPWSSCGKGFIFKLVGLKIEQPSYTLSLAFFPTSFLPHSLSLFSHHLTSFILMPFLFSVGGLALT